MKVINLESLHELRLGSVVRSKASGYAYIVIEINENEAKAVRMQTVTNPIEWELIVDGDEDDELV